MMPAGRPTTYDPEYHPGWMFKFRLLGLTMPEIAEHFRISTETLYAWQQEYPEFSDAVDGGGEQADAKVARSQYIRAVGFTDPKGKYHPPSEKGGAWWLKNRQRKKKRWQDTNNVEVIGKFEQTSDDELNARIAGLIEAQQIPKD